MAHPKTSVPAGPTIPGLGGSSDDARLGRMRRALLECASLAEDRAFGPPRRASDGMCFGGSSSRSAVALLCGCGLLPSGAVAGMSASMASSPLPFGSAMSLAAESATSMMSTRIAPCCCCAAPWRPPSSPG